MTWTRERIEALGPTTDVATVADVLGIGPWTIYEAIRRKKWTLTRVHRVGTRILIPTADLVMSLYGGDGLPG